MKKLAFLPLVLIIAITLVLWRGLFLHPNQLPSPLLNKSLGTFKIPTLFDHHVFLTPQNLKNHITLLNVWATWCEACLEEHAFLLHLATHEKILIIGLAYKDDPHAAQSWLKKNGNPYKIVGNDLTGTFAIDWGVYGTPETFIIDKNGIVRYKHIGPLTAAIWQEQLKPLIETLQGTSS